MKIDAIGFHGQVDNFISAARLAADQGFGRYWLTWAHGMDPLVAIAIASRELPSMKFGTSVIPNVPFHPLALAMAAMTTSQVSQGRLTLGIGASHRPAVEDYYRLPWQPPIRRMREFLDVLLPLMQEGKASVDGQLIGCHVGLGIQAPPPSVMLAALGPKMLELAGSRVDGTVTWMTGPKTLANHTVPTIRKAARRPVDLRQRSSVRSHSASRTTPRRRVPTSRASSSSIRRCHPTRPCSTERKSMARQTSHSSATPTTSRQGSVRSSTRAQRA